MLAVRDPGKRVGHQQLLQLLPSFAEAVDHPVEHFGEVSDLAPAHGQVHREVTRCDFRGTRGESIQRAYNQEAQAVRDEADHKTTAP